MRSKAELGVGRPREEIALELIEEFPDDSVAAPKVADLIRTTQDATHRCYDRMSDHPSAASWSL
jgi:hypothetical protein